MQIRKVQNISDIQRLLRPYMGELSKGFGVKRIGIFGSYSRSEQRPESDVDILVEFDGLIGMIDFISLQEHLKSILGVGVELRRGLRAGFERGEVCMNVRYDLSQLENALKQLLEG